MHKKDEIEINFLFSYWGKTCKLLMIITNLVFIRHKFDLYL